MTKILKFLKKYLYCRWAHRKHLCYPTVWDKEVAEKWEIPYDPDAWHCCKCHPCGEIFDMLEKLERKNEH